MYLAKEQAALLHAEGVLAESKQDIIRSFCMQTEMNPGLKKPVGHIALSYSVVDAPKLTDEKMVQLAQEYMREMKITDTQYIIVRHQDREHPHVHIVFNRIDNNGKTISDSNDMYPERASLQKAERKTRTVFCQRKRACETVSSKRAGQNEIREIYTAIKTEIGKSKELAAATKAISGKGYRHPVQIQRGRRMIYRAFPFSKVNTRSKARRLTAISVFQNWINILGMQG